MLDSIDLRIHGIEKHSALCDTIRDHANGITKYRYNMDSSFEKMNNPAFDSKSKVGENINDIELENGSLTDRAIKSHFENLDGLKSWSELSPEVQDIKERANYRDFIHFWDRSKRVEIFTSKKKKIKSSFYDLAVWFDKEKDYIQISFSIPKYIYGENIHQFVPHPTTNNYRFNETENYEYQKQLDMCFERLMKFINLFFVREFECVNGAINDKKLEQAYIHEDFELVDELQQNTRLYYNHIEIVRLDLCYNMIFKDEQTKSGHVVNGKARAINYFNELRSIKKKYDRNGSGGYGNTIYFNTVLHSFKIYHKGTEYKANDKKKHKAINNAEYLSGNTDKKENGIFDTEYLQNLGDRTLRYEMYFHRKFMSYLWKRYALKLKSYTNVTENIIGSFNRGDLGDMNRIAYTYEMKRKCLNAYETAKRNDKKYYAEISTLNSGYENLAKALDNVHYARQRKIIEKKYKKKQYDKETLKFLPFEYCLKDWTKEQIEDTESVKAYLNKRTYFMMECDKGIWNYYYKTCNTKKAPIRQLGLKPLAVCPFNKDLLISMGSTFMDFVKQFTLKKSGILEDIKLDLKVKAMSMTEKREMYKNDSRFSQIEIPQGLNPNKLNVPIKFLELGMSLDEIKAMKLWSDSTFYRYKKILKEYGVTEQTNVMQNLEEKEISFKDYYMEYRQFNRLIKTTNQANYYSISA